MDGDGTEEKKETEEGAAVEEGGAQPESRKATKQKVVGKKKVAAQAEPEKSLDLSKEPSKQKMINETSQFSN